MPKLCNHCAHSPCVQVCPVGATFESPDGVVLVDKTYCLGCRYCVQACPYGCRFIDPRTNTVDKCSLCYHRITKGLTTACCETCPTGARTLGDLKNPDDPIHEFLRHAQGAGSQAADGHRIQDLLQRSGRVGPVGGNDGSSFTRSRASSIPTRRSSSGASSSSSTRSSPGSSPARSSSPRSSGSSTWRRSGRPTGWPC